MQDEVFITGACGMMGSHMIDHYFERGQMVHGTYYKPTTNLSEYSHRAHLHECDVRYYHSVYKALKKVKPTVIFHLAAQSYPTVSLARPEETMDTNVTGTINVFEAVKEIRADDPSYDPVVVVACSSAEYGSSLTPENVPIKEDVVLLPLHPYGVSKVGQDLLSYQYHISDGIRSVRARIFNTTGPRKVNDVTSDFTKRAVLIEKGAPNVFKVGNLETRRAITDVRDLINAMFLLSQKGKAGEVYNISGNKVYKISELVEKIEAMIGFKLNVEVDPALLRPTDEPIIYGDSSRLKEHTGWEQQYGIDRTLGDMLEYWRKVL
jgi:GDP-4-dehydro-6-deoxy-D-mannose reductase